MPLPLRSRELEALGVLAAVLLGVGVGWGAAAAAACSAAAAAAPPPSVRGEASGEQVSLEVWPPLASPGLLRTTDSTGVPGLVGGSGSAQGYGVAGEGDE